MSKDKLTVCLMGEAPRIGSGWRTIEVLTRGRKYVTVRYAPRKVRHKFTKSVWASIESSARPAQD